MALWEFHEVYKALNVEDVYWYPNKCIPRWWEDYSKFDSDPSSAIAHVVKFSKYTSELNVIHEDVIMRLFMIPLEARQRNWVKHSCIPKSIPSMEVFILKFLKHWGLRFQRFEDTL